MNIYENFLIEIRADKINHHGRTLLEHLKGTQQLLLEWGNNQTIALAGLMHSIYGTQEFKEKAISFKKRPQVTSLLGKKSEELVYLFGVADRREFYKQNNEEPFHVCSSELNNEQVIISKEQYTSLIEIEVANIVEQALHQKNVPIHVRDFWLNSFNSKCSFISSKGTASYIEVLSSYDTKYENI
jgi:hypothetical protein